MPPARTGSCPLSALAVYTGSAHGSSTTMRRSVADFGAYLADQGITLVYGGGRVGLMGEIADAVVDAGGKTIGVMPRHLVDRELAHDRLTELHIVDTLHERKARMTELADAFVALPGGPGTLDEFFEAWTWGQLGLHRKPIALFDIENYWSDLVAMVQHMADSGFLSRHHADALIVSDDAADLLARLRTWTAPTEKWT
jgi:uncharacterized protein (TIGR00730 family)